ncbi:hypothetical protein C0993_005923, partial [Termitomyces sp. T159_Od127]
MTDDFKRLVSSANPATRYRPANDLYNEYPQSFSMAPYSDQPQPTMDPFFDDDDDNVPDSAFGRRNAMASQDSGLPLARSAVLPAGVGSSKLSLGDGVPQAWNFDDDHFQPVATPSSQHAKPMTKKREWRWKWKWQKDKALTGERVIALNNSAANGEFSSNSISTSKYNLVTFIPKFLFEQFSKYANLFFLFTACIQQIPGVSPTNRYTTIVPLAVVLLASAFKEAQEDLKRHQSDSELNARKAKALTSNSTFAEKKWKDIKVGDVVRLESDDFIPADMILISSSEPEGLCYIETSNLDGETNLKIKQASPHTASLVAPSLVNTLRGSLRSENPNNSLYTYEGTLDLITPEGMPKQVPLGPDQMLLRGAQIRNTPWVYGLTVFTGHETKLMRNATAAPIKRTAVERQVNVQIVFLFILLLVLSVGSTIGSSIRTWFFSSQQWYLAEATTLTSREELGQIEYVFSDKTGTLTCNEMEFRCCSIAGVAYADVVDESKRDTEGGDGWKSFTEMRAIFERHSNPFVDTGSGSSTDTSEERERETLQEFLTLLAVCHTVIPEVRNGKTVFQASSPDEAALVAGAELLGYKFHTRKPKSVFINIHGQDEEFEILNICEFNSSRKRMSTLIRAPNGKIKIYTKGADTVILERLSKNQPYTDKTLAHLEVTTFMIYFVVNSKVLDKNYATEGLRTLCLAYRDISEEEYQQWSAIYHQAAATINGRGEALDQAAELIEKELFLLGATAIEDKLQDGVPDTIHTLQMAGIKVWVLTGDRQETAINIGMSCRLISESMNLIIVNEESARETEQFLTKRLNAIKNQRNSGESEDLALIIDGKSLGFALQKEISHIFLELAIMCKAVICCRVSPLQKALVVKLVKKNQKAILLAVGDGANDVSMIQAAHVGVGISGVEGLQAARSADVAISQFRFLKKLLLYSFFNNFSGQIAYESWTLSLYNVVFTVLPPLVIGIFDQFVSARILDRYPQLYMLGQKNEFFTKTAFWLWIVNALYHSILLFGFSVILFWGDLKQADGLDSGHWFWGTTLYLAVLLTVLGKAALISDLWTKYTVA